MRKAVVLFSATNDKFTLYLEMLWINSEGKSVNWNLTSVKNLSQRHIVLIIPYQVSPFTTPHTLECDPVHPFLAEGYLTSLWIHLLVFLQDGHVFDKEPKNLSRKSRPLENGDVKSGKKQQKNKSKSAGALLELGLSDSDADLSLTTLDLSSSSDSSFQLNKSLKGEYGKSFYWYLPQEYMAHGGGGGLYVCLQNRVPSHETHKQNKTPLSLAMLWVRCTLCATSFWVKVVMPRTCMLWALPVLMSHLLSPSSSPSFVVMSCCSILLQICRVLSILVNSFTEAGLHLDNLSSTSLSSLDSEDLLGGFPHWALTGLEDMSSTLRHQHTLRPFLLSIRLWHTQMHIVFFSHSLHCMHFIS